jgi:hypothetical protein
MHVPRSQTPLPPPGSEQRSTLFISRQVLERHAGSTLHCVTYLAHSWG